MVRSIDWTSGALRAPLESSPCVFLPYPAIEAAACTALRPGNTLVHQRRTISQAVLPGDAIEREAIETDDGDARRPFAQPMRGPAHDRAARAVRSHAAGGVRRELDHFES